jgi:2-polyprenyl-3-methyl-5-hydroxy-6-metoxy-1,4-benzoquinol methylase
MKRYLCLLFLAGVFRAAGQQEDSIGLRFDAVYTAHPELYNAEPTPLLVRAVRDLKPGKALDMAMGQGRNSLFLAKQGWDVTGYDVSKEGLAVAQAGAKKAGVNINAVRASHKDFAFGKERWDLIVMAYTLVDMEDAAFLGRLHDSLKPGGVIVLEQMNSGGTGKGPKNALLASFQNYRVLHYEDVVDTAEWGRKPMRLGRIVAQKE